MKLIGHFHCQCITISYPVLLTRLRNTAGNLSKTASALGAMAGETGKEFGARLQRRSCISQSDLGSQGGGQRRFRPPSSGLRPDTLSTVKAVNFIMEHVRSQEQFTGCAHCSWLRTCSMMRPLSPRRRDVP